MMIREVEYSPSLLKLMYHWMDHHQHHDFLSSHFTPIFSSFNELHYSRDRSDSYWCNCCCCNWCEKRENKRRMERWGWGMTRRDEERHDSQPFDTSCDRILIMMFRCILNDAETKIKVINIISLEFLGLNPSELSSFFSQMILSDFSSEHFWRKNSPAKNSENCLFD